MLSFFHALKGSRLLGLFIVSFACALALSCPPVLSPAIAIPPQRFIIEDPLVFPRQDELFFSCSLTVDEIGGLHNILKDGAVLELAVDLSLERKRSWWTNSEVETRRYTSILRHDPLTRDFILSRLSLSGEEITRGRNLNRLLHTYWGSIQLSVAPMSAIQEAGPDREFILTARFSLHHTEVPPWLQNSVGFWSSAVVPDKSVVIEFHN